MTSYAFQARRLTAGSCSMMAENTRTGKRHDQILRPRGHRHRFCHSDYRRRTRAELHAIQTLTLSDAQFLKGDNEAKAATVSGQLRVAQGSGRLPVVVLIH